MKVVTICPHYPPLPGGVSDFVQRWARALADRGEEVAVWTSNDAREDHPGVALVPHEGWGFLAMRRLVERLSRVKPDVIVLQYVPHLYQRRGLSLAPNLAVWALSRVAPVVTLAHELYYGRHEGWRVQPVGWVQRAALVPLVQGSACMVLTVPDRFARLQALFPSGRYRLMPVGANLEPAPPATGQAWRQAHGLAPDEVALLFLGLPHPSKELDMLRAALDLLEAEGVPARLFLAGGATLDHPRAVALGYVPPDEAAAALAGADLFLLPLADGASTRRTSLMNALAAGLAVVSTQGPNTDAVLFQRALELVPAGDARTFAIATLELARDPIRRARRAEAGRQLYEERFAWPVLAERWQRLLEDVLQGNTSHGG